jgi:hypothetical protein
MKIRPGRQWKLLGTAVTIYPEQCSRACVHFPGDVGEIAARRHVEIGDARVATHQDAFEDREGLFILVPIDVKSVVSSSWVAWHLHAARHLVRFPVRSRDGGSCSHKAATVNVREDTSTTTCEEPARFGRQRKRDSRQQTRRTRRPLRRHVEGERRLLSSALRWRTVGPYRSL